MKIFRVTYKLLILVSLALIAIPVMYVYSFTNKSSILNTKQKQYRKKWLQRVVKAIGLEVQVKGKATDEQSALWIANHVSWMDIAVVGSQGVAFLSKSEVRKWPLIGWLGEKAGVIFIERGGKNASQKAGKAIAEKISDGDNILVFPEGTTSTGENVMRFHARIFAPALDHQLLVQPIAVHYQDEKGQFHPKVVWKDQSFMSNMIGILAQARINVVVTFLPVIDAQNFSERRELAELIENQIRDVVLSSSAMKIA